MKLVNTQVSKTCGTKIPCRFESGPRHKSKKYAILSPNFCSEEVKKYDMSKEQESELSEIIVKHTKEGDKEGGYEAFCRALASGDIQTEGPIDGATAVNLIVIKAAQTDEV